MRGAIRRTIRSRKLRVDQTEAETTLWNRIRNRQLSAYKFVRQEPIGPYICDFVYRAELVIIEVDGGQHSASTRDQARDRYLCAQGYRVMRF